MRCHQLAKRFNERILSGPLSPAEHDSDLGAFSRPLDGVRHVTTQVSVHAPRRLHKSPLGQTSRTGGSPRPSHNGEALPQVVLIVLATPWTEVDRAVLAAVRLTQPPAPRVRRLLARCSASSLPLKEIRGLQKRNPSDASEVVVMLLDDAQAIARPYDRKFPLNLANASALSPCHRHVRQRLHHPRSRFASSALAISLLTIGLCATPLVPLVAVEAGLAEKPVDLRLSPAECAPRMAHSARSASLCEG